MKNKIFILVLVSNSVFGFAQTQTENLNAQLSEMKQYFLTGDVENFANYTHPQIFEMMGGKSEMVKVTEDTINQMKSDGFSFTDLNFKNLSEFLKKGDELQCSLTQVIVMKTPSGIMEVETTLIGISEDNGQNWTFIDTSGKGKEAMLMYFPNLHKDLIIKPKKQKMIE